MNVCNYADVGANRRCSDGGIWGNSNIAKLLDEGKPGIPRHKSLKFPDTKA